MCHLELYREKLFYPLDDLYIPLAADIFSHFGAWKNMVDYNYVRQIII